MKFEAKLQELAQNKEIILVFVDIKYIEVLENWLSFVDDHTITNILVISLDEKLHEILIRRNIPTWRLEWTGFLCDLWVERVKIIKEVVSLGYDVIHSDADAVWLKNPIDIINIIDADLIFSQGTVWPQEVHRKWGFVLCCGFFSIRSTVESIAFMEEWLKVVEKDKDDQRALNNLFFMKGIQWSKVDADYNLSFKGHKLKCFDGHITGSYSLFLNICLLPHSMFQRVNEDKPAVVKHLISGKTDSGTIAVLKEFQCWKIS